MLKCYVHCSIQQAIDATDNGINQYDTDQPPKYVINTYLSSRIGRLNVDWVDPDQSSEKENEAFQHAMTLAGKEFREVWLSVQKFLSLFGFVLILI